MLRRCRSSRGRQPLNPIVASTTPRRSSRLCRCSAGGRRRWRNAKHRRDAAGWCCFGRTAGGRPDAACRRGWRRDNRCCGARHGTRACAFTRRFADTRCRAGCRKPYRRRRKRIRLQQEPCRSRPSNRSRRLQRERRASNGRRLRLGQSGRASRGLLAIETSSPSQPARSASARLDMARFFSRPRSGPLRRTPF